MTCRENLDMVGRLFGHSTRAARDAVKSSFRRSIWSRQRPSLEGNSEGIRRKLDLAASLVGAPRLLLLDEPR